jgi:hypothetical protein
MLWASFVVMPFIEAIMSLLRYAPYREDVVNNRPTLLPLSVLFIAALGYASGFRAVTSFLALLFSGFSIAILMVAFQYYGRQ